MQRSGAPNPSGWQTSAPQTNLRPKHLWLDYAEEADMLYISLRKPQRATDSDMGGRFISHYNVSELVGVTVLRARASTGASTE
jgi:uncharacterized protein YuzE